MRQSKFTSIVLLAFWILSFNAFTPMAQTVIFQKTFGGSKLDIGYCVKQTTDGGYILVGDTDNYGAGSRDVYLIKTNITGDAIWTKTFGGDSRDEGYSVQQTVDGGYIIAGFTESIGVGGWDVYLIKTDANGNTAWTKTFGGIGQDVCEYVQQTSDGGYILAGKTSSFGAGNWDVYLIKTDTNGNELWAKTFGGAYPDGAHSIRQTIDGGYIVAGETYTGVDYRAYLIKTNANGNSVWEKTFASHSSGGEVQQTSDGGYIIAGYIKFLAENFWEWDIYAIKTDANGNTLWTKNFDGRSEDVGYSVQQTPEGGYILAGRARSYTTNDWNVFLIKITSVGDTLWTRSLGGNSRDEGYFVRQTVDGGYVITGATFSFGAGNYDVYLIKTDGKGIVTSVQDFTSPARPKEFKIYQNHPNPFNPSTTIMYDVPRRSLVSLKIYNGLGVEIATLVNEVKPVGSEKVQWRADGLPSGLYFYRLQAGDFVKTQKMLLLR